MTKSLFLMSLVLIAACAAPSDTMTPPTGDLRVTQFMVYPNGLAGVVGTVDNSARTLTAVLPHTANLTDVLPVIDHNGIAISPPDNQFSDMSQPVAYTLTAADGTQLQYTATVTKFSAPKSILGFYFTGLDGAVGVIQETQGTIEVLLPHGTNPNGLAPTINFTGTSVAPQSGVAQNFSQPVTYTVTGADGLTKVYTVTVAVDPLSNTKDITAFGFDNSNGNPQQYVVTSAGTNIVVAVVGADVKTLIPLVVHNGASVSPPSGVQRDFTNPVVFTVRAENGTTKAWTVTLLVH